MEDPVAEVRDVVRAVTEPFKASDIIQNVEKYYTEDAVLHHPVFLVPKGPNSREAVKGIYKMLRATSVDQEIEFHAVMFNEDKTQVSIDLTEHMGIRGFPTPRVALRLLVRLHLVQGEDGKYRIAKQEDNFASNMGIIPCPQVPSFGALVTIGRTISGIGVAMIGNFLLSRAWFGA